MEEGLLSNTDEAVPPLPPTPRKSIEAKVYGGVFLCLLTLMAAFPFVLIYSAVFVHPTFGLNSLSVSSFNISGSELTSAWEVGLVVKSPSLLCLDWYRRPVVSLLYMNQLLSEAVLPNIDVEFGKANSFTASGALINKRIEDGQVADAIARDWSRGVVPFTVKFTAENIDVNCDNIRVGFSNHSNTGTMLVQDQAFTRCSSKPIYFSHRKNL